MFAGMLEKRENTIREALKKSEEAQIESERVLAEYNKQLADAKAQSAQIIADATLGGRGRQGGHHRPGPDRGRRHDREGARPPSRPRRRPAISELQGSVADTSVACGARA